MTIKMSEIQIKGMPSTLGFWATPESWKELCEWIEAHPAEDKAHLYIAACMAWNLAVKYANEATRHKPN